MSLSACLHIHSPHSSYVQQLALVSASHCYGETSNCVSGRHHMYVAAAKNNVILHFTYGLLWNGLIVLNL